MVREYHEASYGDGDEYGACDYRPQRSGELTSITSRQERIAHIGHDIAEFFHRLDDAGKPICGNCKRDEITRCPHIPRELFAGTSDVKWCILCRRRLGIS